MFQRTRSLLLTLSLLPTFCYLQAVDPTQKNVVYGMDHGASLLMDVYQPESQNGASVIFIMGTGFTAYGEYDDIPLKELDLWLLENGIFKDLYGEAQQAFAPLLDKGFTVFSINHRLGPKNTFETQIADCQRAVQFIRYHADQYGLKPDWIGSMGHSSGATMATFLGVFNDRVQPNAADPIDRESSRTQAVIAAAGVHDMLAVAQSSPSSGSTLLSFIGRAITYQPSGHPVYGTYKRASTISYIDENTPPFFIIHGDADPAVDIAQSQAFKSALDEAKIENELLVLPGANHAELGEPINPLPFLQAADWLHEQFMNSK